MGKGIKSAQQLRRRMDELDKEEKEIGRQILTLGERVKIIEKDRARLQAQLDEFEKEHPIELSDHAVLRYLDRIEGINIGAVKARVLDKRTREAIKTLGGSGTFPVGTSHRIVAKKGKIITVLPY